VNGYQCRVHPITGTNSQKVLRKAYRFLKQWKSDTGLSPPSVEVQSFDRPVRAANGAFVLYGKTSAGTEFGVVIKPYANQLRFITSYPR